MPRSSPLLPVVLALALLGCPPAAERESPPAASAPAGQAPLRLLDTAAAMPGGGAFADFHEVSADSGWIAFLGYARRADGAVAPAGLFRRSPAGRIVRLATAEDAVPDRSGRRFGSIQALYQDGLHTVFLATGNGCSGLYSAPLDGEPVATLADCRTAPEGGAALARFGSFVSAGGEVFFAAAASESGWAIWGAGRGGLRRLVAPGEPRDGEPLTAISPFSLAYRDGRLAFAATGAGGVGIWAREASGALAPLVGGDPATAAIAAPGGAAFLAFDGVGLFADGLAFRAATAAAHGIYRLDAAGAVRPLADTAGGGEAGVRFTGFAEGPVAGGFFVGAYRAPDGTAIEGLFTSGEQGSRCLVRTGGELAGTPIAGFEIDPQPGEDGAIVFPVQFENGTAAIYRVTANAPTGC